MQLDKKMTKSGLKLVLLESIGDASVTDAPDGATLRRVLEAQLAR
jgi:3-dehydroquinate synthetase